MEKLEETIKEIILETLNEELAPFKDDIKKLEGKISYVKASRPILKETQNRIKSNEDDVKKWAREYISRELKATERNIKGWLTEKQIANTVKEILTAHLNDTEYQATRKYVNNIRNELFDRIAKIENNQLKTEQ